MRGSLIIRGKMKKSISQLDYIESAKRLLKEGEALPIAVRETISFFSSRGIWFLLSRNVPVVSCPDAARNRQRLGKVGIPLWDEMKTRLYKTTEDHGDPRYIMVHCRGDRKIQEKLLKETLGISDEMYEVEIGELTEKFGMVKGLVNPFGSFWMENSTQVFDKDLVRNLAPPGTMMTNAGENTWAIEFKVLELIEKCKNGITTAICEHDSTTAKGLWGVRKKKKIAIITGNAPESGTLLLEMINANIRKQLGELSLGDISLPEFVLYSIPELGLTMELDKRENDIWEKLSGTINKACGAGADVLCIACNTTQFYNQKVDAICKSWRTRYISVTGALQLYLYEHDIQKAVIAGIKYVAENSEWSAFHKELRDVQLVALMENEVGFLEKLAYDKKTGKKESLKQGIQSILRTIENGKSQLKKTIPFILALTEVSISLQRDRSAWREFAATSTDEYGRLVIDTLAILANETTKVFLSDKR